MISAILNWLLIFFVKSLVNLLPDRMKRLLVIVSLYNHLISCDSSTEEEKQVKLAALNDALKLAMTSSRSLTLGLLFSKPLWGGKHITSLSDFSRNTIDRYFPPWMRYGRDIDIESDIRNLDMFILNTKYA